MKKVDFLHPFISKVVIDIVEYNEKDAHELNNTYIKISFDDDSFICFPKTEQDFWYSHGD